MSGDAPADQVADVGGAPDQLQCADCGCSLEDTTPVREPWYTPDPDPWGPRLCGLCYAKRIDGG